MHTQAHPISAPIPVNLLAGVGAVETPLPPLRSDPYTVSRSRPRNLRGPQLRRLLLRTDIAVLVLSLAIVESLRWVFWDSSTPVGLLAAFAAVSIPAWLVLAYANGLYHAGSYRVEHDVAEEAGPIFRVTTLWAWSMLLAVILTRGAVNWIEQLALLWAVACALSVAGRALTRAYGRRQIWYLQNALVLGTSAQTASIVRKIMRHHESGVNVVAVVDVTRDDPGIERSEEFSFVPVIGGGVDLEDLINVYDVDRVILSASSHTGDRDDFMHHLSGLGVQVDVIPTPFEALGARVDVHHLEGAPLMTLPLAGLGLSEQLMKRALDIAVSATCFVLALPLLVVCAVAIKLDSRGPLFFRQTRVGRDGKRFTVWKFRSMHADADARKSEVAYLNLHADGDESMFKIRDDPRVTRVGRILRRYSLDELPQICNVLVGDMSLVGPRPLIEEEAGPVAGRFRRRLALTPGVTGLWQVNGRSEIPFAEMVSLDYLYVTNWTLWGDVKLLMKTLPAVARGNGAY
jgi:exopolysaccharide biosynthesis polyprenyl glycosylphosphotransferase